MSFSFFLLDLIAQPSANAQALTERTRTFADFINPKAELKGSTPLHYAVLADSLEIVELLLAKNASPVATVYLFLCCFLI
jgi:ankyrin repeat protein